MATTTSFSPRVSTPILQPTASPINKAAVYRRMDVGRLETLALDRIHNSTQYFEDVKKLAKARGLSSRFKNHNVTVYAPSGDVQAMMDALTEKGRVKTAEELREAELKFRQAYSFDQGLSSRLYD